MTKELWYSLGIKEQMSNIHGEEKGVTQSHAFSFIIINTDMYSNNTDSN